MTKTPTLIFLLLASMASPVLPADSVTQLQNLYRAHGAGDFNPDRGERLWNSRFYQDRQCAGCHGADLKRSGKHQRTNKTIEPMAPSVVTNRYTDPDKVEQWFTRNCKWTWGRACTPQEKGDLLEYLKTQ